MEVPFISFIKQYGVLLSDNFRPSTWQEDEGGDLTIEELDTEVFEGIRTDSDVTREVIRRLFGAIPKEYIKCYYPKFSKEVKRVYEKYLNSEYVFIDFDVFILQLSHTLTIVRIDDKDYLIQSYTDVYSYDIKIIDNIEIFFSIELLSSIENNDISYLRKIIVDKESEYSSPKQILEYEKCRFGKNKNTTKS